MRGKLQFSIADARFTATFNEARALCAGSFGSVRPLAARRHAFNEARALCAGSSCAEGYAKGGG